MFLRIESWAGRRLGSRAMGVIYHENVFFSGHVQGVGFRYAVLQVAKEYEVAGVVANLADGRVQLEAEGAEAERTRTVLLVVLVVAVPLQRL